MLSCLVGTFVENIFVGWYVSWEQEDVLSLVICFRIFQHKDSNKLGGVEIECYTSVSGLCE
jgi:hypothetical protein